MALPVVPPLPPGAAVGRTGRVAPEVAAPPVAVPLVWGAVRVGAAVDRAGGHLGAGAPRLEDAASGVTGRVGTSSAIAAVGVAAGGVASRWSRRVRVAAVVVAVGQKRHRSTHGPSRRPVVVASAATSAAATGTAVTAPPAAPVPAPPALVPELAPVPEPAPPPLRPSRRRSTIGEQRRSAGRAGA